MAWEAHGWEEKVEVVLVDLDCFSGTLLVKECLPASGVKEGGEEDTLDLEEVEPSLPRAIAILFQSYLVN